MTPPLTRHDLGRQGFGTMRLREEASADPDRDPVAVVHAAPDAGLALVDTADAYQNEGLVGRAIRGRRDEVLLATKFGLVWREDVAGDFDVRADPAYVRTACEASLRRLGVDVIDLFYLHHRSQDVPVEDTAGAVGDLVTEGKVRAFGLSNVTADDLRRAHTVHRVTALQEQWSVTERGIEESLLPAAAELGTVVVAHSPTGHGLLHGEDAPSDLRTALAQIGRDHDATAGQVALAWVHHQQSQHGVPVVPLPGTTRVSHLRTNIAAADLELSTDQLHRLDEVGSSGDPAG